MNMDSSLLEKVKENGTITLDELVMELTKSGVTDIHFDNLSLNLEKLMPEKKGKDFFDIEDVSSFGKDLLSEDLTVMKEEKNTEDKDYQLLNCIIEGNFEVEDAERILSLIEKEKIKKYIISKLEEKDFALRNYVYMLMDLRGN